MATSPRSKTATMSQSTFWSEEHLASLSASPGSEADWLIGADLLLPGVKGVALRNMLHPGTAYDDPRLGKDPQPADMSGKSLLLPI